MDLDVEQHLGAVERSVSSLERDGQPARAVTLVRSYETTVEDLWDAVTNSERHSALVSADQRRPQTRRPLSAGRQRRRVDHGVRSTIASSAHLGVRRGRQLG